MVRTKRSRAVLITTLFVALVAVGCSKKSDTAAAGPDGSTPAGGGTINIVAYSTPQPAYQGIEAAFKKTPAGANVTFKDSFGASGDQSRAVDGGQPADYVAFSLKTDMDRLAKSGKVAADWDKNQYNGMVTESVVVFVVRKGNPKGIKTWDDLTKPGVEVVTPNPFSSGSARWNIMAGWGAASDKGADKAAGDKYLADLFANVVVQDTSGAKALSTFTGGKGDVLLSYENEAIFAQQKNQDIDYVVPDKTILIENPAAVTTSTSNPTTAKAFYDFVYTTEAQKIFADNGYRPVVPGVVAPDKFPTPSGLFTIKDLGGWDSVAKTFFDTKTGLMVAIEQSKGVTVESK